MNPNLYFQTFPSPPFSFCSRRCLYVRPSWWSIIYSIVYNYSCKSSSSISFWIFVVVEENVFNCVFISPMAVVRCASCAITDEFVDIRTVLACAISSILCFYSCSSCVMSRSGSIDALCSSGEAGSFTS